MSLTDDLLAIPEVEVREGFHRHHRQKDREDNTPANVMYVGPLLHDWIEKHPEAARELGWWVDSWQDPKAIPVAIPDTLPVKAEKKPRQKLPPRQRATVQIRVPADEREKGAEVLDTLIEAGREDWAEEMGWKEDVPAYYVLCAGMAKALQS